jgi:hypothetical protein
LEDKCNENQLYDLSHGKNKDSNTAERCLNLIIAPTVSSIRSQFKSALTKKETLSLSSSSKQEVKKQPDPAFSPAIIPRQMMRYFYRPVDKKDKSSTSTTTSTTDGSEKEILSITTSESELNLPSKRASFTSTTTSTTTTTTFAAEPRLPTASSSKLPKSPKLEHPVEPKKEEEKTNVLHK